MEDKYLVSIISALIGAFVAIFTNWWRTRYTIRAQDFSKRIEDIALSISKLEGYACEYWVSDDRSKKSTENFVIGSQTKIELMINYLNEQYKDFGVNEVINAFLDFKNACTGGSFGSPAGNAEPQRVRMILVNGETVKIELMKIRNNQY